jgi:2-keto-4-pentenoate hydratase
LSDVETRTHAESLARARRTGVMMPAVDVPDEGEAYALQDAAIAALGEPLAGWKIGATAEATQKALRVSGPFYGPMPGSDCFESGAALACGPGVRGVECEIAFKLGRDLPRRTASYSREECIAAVEAVHLAIELVASRMRSDEPLHGFQAIADFGLNGAFVAGPAIGAWQSRPLAGIEARCLVDGEEKAHGSAAIVLGDPLNALAWLADEGPGLRAGQWVSSGTLTGLLPVRSGQRITGDFGPLGRVEASLR